MRGRLPDYGIALLAILCLNFALPRLMPGDPIHAIHGPEAMLQMSPEMKARLIERFSLDKPLHHQLASYLSGLARADLGYSYYHSAPVRDVLMGHLPWTLLLVGTAFLLATAAGVLLGIESGWRGGSKLDRALLVAQTSVSGFPGFFIGAMLLLLFGVFLGLFPLQGAKTPYSGLTGLPLMCDVLKHLALPLVSLVFVFMPGMYLLSRGSLLGVVAEPYLLTARAKGLVDRRVRYHHAARNALLPVVTATGTMLASRVVMGALFIEMVFSYPGMGSLVRSALLNRDYPVLQGALLLTAILVLAANLVVDLVYNKLDPRVGHAR